MDRIVITGVGAVTNLGLNAADTWNAMRQGRSGIATLEGAGFDAYEGHWTVTIGGQVKGWDPTKVI